MTARICTSTTVHPPKRTLPTVLCLWFWRCQYPRPHLLTGLYSCTIHTSCISVILLQTVIYIHRVWRKRRSQQFSLHNFNKCRHSFVIFGTNHPEDSLYYENRKFVPTAITSLRSDDVIVTSSKTTLSRTASRKDTKTLEN